MPVPVSASPPSRRRPTSSVGTRAPPLASATARDPSSITRTRLVPDSLAARLPASPVAASEVIRCTTASVRSASSSGSSSVAATTTPRAPAAAIVIEVSVVQRPVPSTSSSRVPLP